MTTDFERELGRGSTTIGALVYWTSLKDCKLSRVLFKQGMELCGVGDAVKTPKTETLLTEACSRAARHQGRDVDPVKLELKSKGQESVYRVMMRRDVDGRARTIEEAQIAVDRYAVGATPTVKTLDGVPPDAQRDRILDDVVEWFSELQMNVFAPEVSDVLVESMEILNALSLRTGCYFVTADQMDKVRAIAAFLAANTRAKITIWDMRATPENVATARVDAYESFVDKLADLTMRVKKFTDRVSVEDATARSVNAKIREFKDLDAQVDLWADVLGDAQASLRESIENARTAILGDYLGLADDSLDADDKTDDVAA